MKSLNRADAEYYRLLLEIMSNGIDKNDRTGTGTKSVFGRQIRFNMKDGFPLLTTKKLHIKSIVHELLWFLSGDTNTKYLNENGVTIWDEWADDNGDLGPVYGKQWRDFEGVDQLSQVIEDIKNNPNSRRHIVSAWNPKEIPVMIKSGLPPCHTLFQFYVSEGKLSCQLYQRSADVFLGVPYNIASYALLTCMIASVTDLEVGEFIHSLGDTHIYINHLDQVEEQLSRKPYDLPTIEINNKETLFEYDYEDFVLKDYKSHPFISAPIAV